MIRIVDKFIAELSAMTKDRNVSITLGDGVKEWLAIKGYDPLMGARPLGRVIHNNIKKPLSRLLLSSALKHGGEVNIGLHDDQLTTTITNTIQLAA